VTFTGNAGVIGDVVIAVSSMALKIAVDEDYKLVSGGISPKFLFTYDTFNNAGAHGGTASSNSMTANPDATAQGLTGHTEVSGSSTLNDRVWMVHTGGNPKYAALVGL
jgi:hypothetical protein